MMLHRIAQFLTKNPPLGAGSLLLAAVCAGPSPLAAAPVLSLPDTARQTAQVAKANDSYALPVGPWAQGRLETLPLTGAVEHRSWRLPGLERETLDLMQDLTAQLTAAGYTTLYFCAGDTCGGFDFRYEINILPEPEMHVDLGDFRFLSAKKQLASGTDYMAILVSRAKDTGFVQITHVGPGGSPVKPAAPVVPDDTAAAAQEAAPPQPAATLTETLETAGVVVLEDLNFASGATELGPGSYASLKSLATYLRDHPARQVVIVGHTDADGPLSVNVTLSRQRAQSVADRLIADHGVNPAQITAEGAGYLAPRAANLTEAGRQKNRRVEAVLASTR